MADDQDIAPGADGFLSIFNDDDGVSPESPDPDADAPDRADAADVPEPEEDPDGDDLTADERVAANLAASLEAEGIELPDETEDDDEHPLLAEGADDDLDNLTPAQLRELAAEAIKLRQEITQSDEQRVADDIEAVEQNASATWKQTIDLADSHYSGILEQRLDSLWDEAQEQQNPKAWFSQQRRVVRQTIEQARQTWLAAQQEDITNEVLAAKREKLRPFYAKHLATEAGLPDGAVAEILKVKDPDEFPARVAELVAIREALRKNRKRSQQDVRAEGRKRLAETAVHSPSTGRARSRQPVPYTGEPAEGLSIIRSLRS